MPPNSVAIGGYLAAAARSGVSFCLRVRDNESSGFRMANQGLFLSFEGMDGSGKTTQMRRLAARLRGLGRTVLETVEPGGPPIAAKIRSILLDSAHQELSPVTEVLLYFASRSQNVDEWIVPALARGEIVLSDRFSLLIVRTLACLRVQVRISPDGPEPPNHLGPLSGGLSGTCDGFYWRIMGAVSCFA